ncbi:diguanylate cyclase [Psychromonas ingrahamii 37]|uniref:diguanylate cyclase n=1 Tax=Psychromonas ingrahamii (strain DSM 17664 / CCUG 51855 / 37) TaxID=357804 RepID=A1SVT3_PSYIN|nr:GGDEF domain-containing protein [Psychromonas ingrahamii]ABM03598.1 diguanylate cyclase [Psychromonas ingrahamii 37]
MKKNAVPNLNDFFSGHLIVNKARKILYCNNYICDLSDQSDKSLIDNPLSKFVTKASNIFIDSYVYPLLMHQSCAQEIQITWIGKNGETIPVVVNIKLGSEDISYWSLYVCENRDKLHSELLKANEKLEKQSQELFRLATTDPLTGLLNRRELQVQAQKVTHQAARNLSTFALLFIDIDFFKRVNDTYGHPAGDKVLICLANILTQERRVTDIVARMGGEEFALLLPNIDEENAYKLAERLRKKIEKQTIDHIKITVSIGLVVTRKNTQTNFDILLELADQALYESKEWGRNRTHVAQL